MKRSTLSIKKITFPLVIFTFLFSFEIQGQAKIELTPIWLPQFNWLINQDDDRAGDKLDYDWTKSYSLDNYGVLIGIKGKNRIGVETGFIISNQGQRFINRQTDINGEIEEFPSQIKLSYYKIPLLFFYKPNSVEKKSGLILKVGGQVSLLQESKYFARGNELNFYNNQGNLFDVTSAYENYNIDLVLGFGYIRTISKNLSFYSMIRIDYSVNDIEKKDILFEGQPFYDLQRFSTLATTGGISIGFTLSL